MVLRFLNIRLLVLLIIILIDGSYFIRICPPEGLALANCHESLVDHTSCSALYLLDSHGRGLVVLQLRISSLVNHI